MADAETIQNNDGTDSSSPDSTTTTDARVSSMAVGDPHVMRLDGVWADFKGADGSTYRYFEYQGVSITARVQVLNEAGESVFDQVEVRTPLHTITTNTDDILVDGISSDSSYSREGQPIVVLPYLIGPKGYVIITEGKAKLTVHRCNGAEPDFEGTILAGRTFMQIFLDLPVDWINGRGICCDYATDADTTPYLI